MLSWGRQGIAPVAPSITLPPRFAGGLLRFASQIMIDVADQEVAK
jgi:hypothetical protein